MSWWKKLFGQQGGTNKTPTDSDTCCQQHNCDVKAQDTSLPKHDTSTARSKSSVDLMCDVAKRGGDIYDFAKKCAEMEAKRRRGE